MLAGIFALRPAALPAQGRLVLCSACLSRFVASLWSLSIAPGRYLIFAETFSRLLLLFSFRSTPFPPGFANFSPTPSALHSRSSSIQCAAESFPFPPFSPSPLRRFPPFSIVPVLFHWCLSSLRRF